MRADALTATVDALLAAVGASDATVSLSIVRDRAMRAINNEHREKDTPTDVLSFPMYEPDAFDRRRATRPLDLGNGEKMLGDIVIALDTARRQAADYDAPLEREVERLLIHSVLHLCGHDHHEPGERAIMEAEERRLANVIGMPWPYLEHA